VGLRGGTWTDKVGATSQVITLSDCLFSEDISISGTAPPHIISRRMQKNTLRCLVLTLLAALTSGAICLGAEGKANLESLLAQAFKLQNVWSDGTPAVKVRTDIKILYAGGKTAPGRYVVTWISSSRWRDELEFSDYKRVRVHDSKGFWQQSTLGYT
jgi:hypothetical protein